MAEQKTAERVLRQKYNPKGKNTLEACLKRTPGGIWSQGVSYKNWLCEDTHRFMLLGKILKCFVSFIIATFKMNNSVHSSLKDTQEKVKRADLTKTKNVIFLKTQIN